MERFYPLASGNSTHNRVYSSSKDDTPVQQQKTRFAFGKSPSMRVNTKYINSTRGTSAKKKKEEEKNVLKHLGFCRRCSCVTQLVAIDIDTATDTDTETDTDTDIIIFASPSTSNSNTTAAAEGAALVMQATVVRSYVLTGTAHPTNFATRN